MSMIRRLQDVFNDVDKSRMIIVLFSGGLDGTFLLTMLAKSGYKNLLALHADIGGEEKFDEVKQILEGLNIHTDVMPLTEYFIENFLVNAIYSQATYLGGHPLSASLSRPLIVQKSIEYIEKNRLKNPVLLHTSNSSQNSLRRFNNSLMDLQYNGLFGSPFEKTSISRINKIDYLQQNNIDYNFRIHSEDSNIWCREFEYGEFDNIENMDIPDSVYLWTKPSNDPHEEIINVGFENGIPISIDGSKLLLKEIILTLRRKVGQFGIGRYSGLEEIQSGEKVLEVREAPSATILLSAYKNLELATINSETARVKQHMEQIWVREAIEGRWFQKLRKACDLFCKEISIGITGSVSFKLSKNTLSLLSVKSNHPNYIVDRAIFEERQI